MKRLKSSTTFRIFILSVFCLSSIAALLAANLYLASSAESRKEAITLRATGRSNSRINFQNGRNLKAQYAAADVASAGIEKAFGQGKQGQAQALSLASDDINLDGFPDLVCGYAGSDGGLVTLHLGNSEAFSPARQETIQGIIKGRYPDPFVADALVLPVPESPDFLATGDFNRDGRLDILTAARGGSALYLLAGDENHGFNPAKALPLSGNVTAMAVAPKSEQDGGMSVAVGINGSDGPTVLVYEAQRSILEQKPSAHALPAAANAITPGRLDEDRSTDLAIIAGGQLYVLHGQANKAAPDGIIPDQQAGQLEPVALPFAVKTVAVSDFIWDRDARMELAVAADSGAVHIVARGELATRPLTAGEVLARRQLVAEVRQGKKPLAALAARRPDQALTWQVAETTSLTLSNAGDAAQPLLMSTLASGQQSHDLLVVNPGARQLQIAFKENQKEALAAGRQSITFDTQSEPVAALSMRLNVMGRPGLVVMRKGHVEPVYLMMAPSATITVSTTADTVDAAGGSCAAITIGSLPGPDGVTSLREAVCAANNTAGADTITLPSGTYQLTRPGDDNNANNGDLDLNDDVTIVGNGAANTIIQGSSDASFTSNMGDKIFGINQDGIHDTLNVSISGLTVRFTKNTNAVGGFTETGGAMDIFLTGAGASPGPTVTVTNCTFDSNAAQNGNGGAINIDSGDLLGGTNIFRGTVQFTGCTISNNRTLDPGAALPGGGVNLFADKHDVTFTNCTITGNQTSANIGSNGGGINIRHNSGGTITLNTTTVSNNTSGSDGGGILTSSIGAQTLNINGGSISGNTAQGTGDSADGGGIFSATNIGGSTSLSGVTISNNVATAGASGRGGGILDGANVPLTINNCTISGNSSDNGGGVATTNTGGTQTTTITNSTISGNTATTGGALFVSSGILNASLNRIVNNTAATGSGIARTGGTATVENNWWGCDGFPNAAGCQTGSGTFDADPRIDLRLTASPATILTGGSSTLTADVSQNTNGAAINPTVLNGLTITFAGTLGTVSPTTATLTGLMASSTFTSIACGTATVSATLDSGTQTANITINQPPTLSACSANITTNTDPSQCSAVVTYTAPTATAGCPTPTVTCTPPSGSTFPKGTTTVTCTATNGVSPDATCSFTVTVNDNQTPVLSACPTNITTAENPPGSGGAVVTYTPPTATDNCPITVNCVPPSGSTFPVGTTTVNCTANDGTNSASCSFNVTVIAACTITCPTNIVVPNSPGLCGANVSFAPTVTGSCGTVTCSPPSGSFFAVGTTAVSCTTGTGPSCGFTVTVNDTEAPIVTLNSMDFELWPPNHQYETIQVSSLVTDVMDNCDGTIPVSSVVIAQVSSDELENGTDDGNTTNDIVIAPDCKSVQLRAERRESGNGRVYTITLQVKDSRGNVQTVTKTVGVPINPSSSSAVLGPGPGYSVTSSCVLAPLSFSRRLR